MALTTEAALRKDRTSAKSTMEHRHFATIADIIKRNRPDDSWLAEIDQWSSMAKMFADELRHTNPKFDRARFLKACNAEDRI